MCAAFARNSENVIQSGGCHIIDNMAARTDNLPERSVLKEFKFTKGRVKSIFNNFFLNFQHLFFSSTNCVNNKCIQTTTWLKCQTTAFIWQQIALCTFVGTWLCLCFQLYQLILKTQYKILTGSPPYGQSYIYLAYGLYILF